MMKQEEKGQPQRSFAEFFALSDRRREVGDPLLSTASGLRKDVWPGLGQSAFPSGLSH